MTSNLIVQICYLCEYFRTNLVWILFLKSKRDEEMWLPGVLYSMSDERYPEKGMTFWPRTKENTQFIAVQQSAATRYAPKLKMKSKTAPWNAQVPNRITQKIEKKNSKREERNEDR
jgi:hypothetical protein